MENAYYRCSVKLIADAEIGKKPKTRSISLLVYESGVTEVEKRVNEYMTGTVDLWEITNVAKTNIEDVLDDKKEIKIIES